MLSAAFRGGELGRTFSIDSDDQLGAILQEVWVLEHLFRGFHCEMTLVVFGKALEPYKRSIRERTASQTDRSSSGVLVIRRIVFRSSAPKSDM